MMVLIMVMVMVVVMVVLLTLGKPLDLFNLPWSLPLAASPGLVSTWPRSLWWGQDEQLGRWREWRWEWSFWSCCWLTRCSLPSAGSDLPQPCRLALPCLIFPYLCLATFNKSSIHDCHFKYLCWKVKVNHFILLLHFDSAKEATNCQKHQCAPLLISLIELSRSVFRVPSAVLGPAQHCSCDCIRK